MTLDKVYKYANNNRKTVMWVLLALVAALTIPMLLLNFELSTREGLSTGDADLDQALETLEAITNQTENMSGKEDSGFEGMQDGSPGSPEASGDDKDKKLQDIKRTVIDLKNQLDDM